MPTYVYKFIDTGETIEVQQSFNDATLTEAVHPESGDTMPVKKVFLPVGVTFKGDGFYKTDNRSKKKSAATPIGERSDAGGSGKSSESGSSSGSSGSESGSSSSSSSDSSSGSTSSSSTKPSATPKSSSSD